MRSSVEPMQSLRISTPAGAPPVHVYRAMLTALAGLIETRDAGAENHLEHVRDCCAGIAGNLARRRSGVAAMSRGFAQMVVEAAALHDLGKAVVPDAVLLKPGRLDARETECIRGHTLAGFQTLSRVIGQIGPHPFLTVARDIAYCHHERWDGGGYPRGLRGREIPLAARIVAVADVFDALVSRRCYKEPIPPARARQIIEEGRGRHFDPAVVDAFAETTVGAA